MFYHKRISSLSSDWVRAVQKTGRFSEYKWNRKQTVFIDTLDSLIAQYGVPAFMKIDVEGFEDQVVSGLSIPVGAISMEFNLPKWVDEEEITRTLFEISSVSFGDLYARLNT